MAKKRKGGDSENRDYFDPVTLEVVTNMVDVFRDSLGTAKDAVIKLDSKLDSNQEEIYQVIEQAVQKVYGGMFELTKLIGKSRQQNQAQTPSTFNIYVGDKEAKKAIDDLGGEVSQVKQKLEELAQAVQDKTPQAAQQTPEYQALQQQISGLRSLMEGFGRELEAQRTIPSNYDELRRRLENVEGQVRQPSQDPRILDAYNEIRRRLDDVEGQVRQPSQDPRVDWMHNKLTDSVPNQMGELKGRMDTLSDRVNSYIEQEAARQAAQQQAARQQGQQQGQGAGQPGAGQQPPYGQQGAGTGQGQRPPQQQGQQRRQRSSGGIARGGDLTLDRLAEEYNAAEEFEMPHIVVHSNYRLTKISVNDYEEFSQEIIKYMKFHHKKLFNTNMTNEEAFIRAQQILESVFKEAGRKKGLTGFEYAYKELAREGRLGDIIHVLRDNEAGQNASSRRAYVLGQVDPLDWDTHVQLAREFKQIYGRIMPKGMEQMSIQQMAANYQGLILYHAAKKKELREILEKYEPVAA